MVKLPRVPPEPGVPEGARTAGSVADFLAEVGALAPSEGRGRLVFALDATMSRQPTWDIACRLQGEMFDEAAGAGGLEVQLVYFRGHGECRASRWTQDARQLAALMTRIECRSGTTQIGRVLGHALSQTRVRKVGALVYVGDAMEEEPDLLCARAGELALLGVPAFIFQEGMDPRAEATFREIARITHGAWCRFDASAARQFAALLRAVAAYASGGHKALAALARREGGGAALLLEQIRGA